MSAADLARQINDLERRLAAMERATRLDQASVIADDGTEIPVRDAVIAANATSLALANAMESYVARVADDGEVNVFYGTDIPGVETTDVVDEGDLWLADDGTLTQWDGTTWADYQDQGLAEAISAAHRVGDSKVQTFWQPTAPTTADDGDLWFDTSNGNVPNVWQDGVWTLLLPGNGASMNYGDGTSGWSVNPDGGNQFDSVSVLNDLGAATITADTLIVGDVDVAAALAAAPAGMIGQDQINSGTNTDWIGLTETVLFRGSVAAVLNGAAYLVMLAGCFRPDSTMHADLRMRYTVDGTVPGTASTVLGRWRLDFPFAASAERAVFRIFSPTADADLLRFAVTIVSLDSGATIQVAQDLGDMPLTFAFVGFGSDSILGNGNLAQISKQPSGGVTPPPDTDKVTQHSRTWTATWSRAYDEDTTTRSPDTNDCYQGYYSTTHGRTRSLFGFDYADIMSRLSGYSSIVSVTLTFRVKYRGWSDGLDVYIAEHDYTSKPTTWDHFRVDEAVANRQNCNQGGTITVTMPNSTAVNFASGTTKGLGFGPGPDNGQSKYGRMYGASSGYEPVLKIVWKA